MEGELGASIRIMIELLVVSVVITILLLFMGAGQQLGRMATEEVVQAQADTYASELVAASQYPTPIPAPSIYNILIRSTSAVNKIEGKAYGVDIDSVDDLTRLFSKKLKLSITEVNEIYNVTISE